MGRKIKLNPKPRKREKRDDWFKIEDWTTSAPFVMSEVGILVHRVRFGTTFRYPPMGVLKQTTHDAVTFWCGNSTTSPVMLYDVPGGRMVCARCEALAAAKASRGPDGQRQKRAADLVGHTVSLGALVAVKVGTQRVKR